MKCEEIREVLPAYADDPEATLAVRRHLSRCPECKAELANYDSILDGLAELRAVASEPPPGLVRSLQRIPNDSSRVEQMRTHLARNRRIYIGGAAAALVGAAGAAVWHTRRSRLSPA